MTQAPIWSSIMGCEMWELQPMTFKNKGFSCKPSLGRRVLVLATVLTALCAPVAPSFAQPETACDPEYMDALESRAYMEAQREISQNQNLIVKPDSVLEYTCFTQFLNLIANDDPSNFVDGGCCGGEPLDPPMDDALENVVNTAVIGYLGANFDHTFLGGRADTDYDTESVAGSATYTCDKMMAVWQEAQCLNFFDEDDHDGFFDFPWYVDQDPRTLPYGECATAIAAEDLSTAFNTEQDHYVLDPENPNDGNPYVRDPVVTHLDLILPVGEDPATDCAEPIRTGVCVNRNNMAPYADAVCPNPGCHYEAPGGGGGGGECPDDPSTLPLGTCVQ